MDERAAREKLDALCLRYQRYEGFLRFLAEQAKAHGLFDKYERKLTALYLRVLQGPIRMAIIGESSAGKSTLLNAFAGDFVAPENSGVCTSELTYLLRHEERNTYVRPYTCGGGELPGVRAVWGTGKLLTRQHGAKAQDAQAAGQKIHPFVYTCGRMMPRGVTLVDTPGLNAAGADTQTTLGLFSAPAYAAKGEKDLPEMLLYMTKGHNLLQTESGSLVRLRELGMDMNSCIVVHNDVRQAYAVTPETFEAVGSGAVEGLRKSLAAFRSGATALPDEDAPEQETLQEDDPWNFDAYLEDEEEPEEDEVFSVNALLARMMYVATDDGVYNVLKYPPEGMTVEEHESWKALHNDDTTQSRLALVRDQWVAQGHSGYAPMQALRDAIERRALRLAGQGGLSDVLDAADVLAREILSDCAAAIDASAGPVPRDELDALADLIRRAKGVLFAFSAEEGAFAKGVESACIAPKAAAALHNSKIELTLKSFAGQKFNLVDLGALVVGNFFAPALLIPLARYLLRDDLPKRYGKLLKDKGLGGRDLDALFDGEPTLAGVGALVQIISDLAAKLSDELWPTAEQMQGIAEKGVDACQQAVSDANKEMIMIESEFITLMKLPEGRALRTEMTFFDDERATKALAERITYLHPELELPEQDELGSRVRGLMHKLKNSGAVTMFNAKDRVYKEIISVVLREAVEALRMPEDQPDCGAVQLIDSLAKPVVTAWKELLEEMTRAYDGRERRISESEEAQAQQLAARKGELAARFDSERPA